MSDVRRQIELLAELMEEYNLVQAELVDNDIKVEFVRERADLASVASILAPAANSSQAEPAPVKAMDAIPVLSPMSGVFYSAPSPGSEPYVKVGADIVAGDCVGLIEAMKVFNEVPSPVSGKVREILAQDGQLVELGEIILLIET
jgi:acetyl-CoA carboxylase biotin carboxyl carrier protein